jgi:hypothetical protein
VADFCSLGLVDLQVKGMLIGKAFTVLRSWLALGKAVPAGSISHKTGTNEGLDGWDIAFCSLI